MSTLQVTQIDKTDLPIIPRKPIPVKREGSERDGEKHEAEDQKLEKTRKGEELTWIHRMDSIVLVSLSCFSYAAGTPICADLTSSRDVSSRSILRGSVCAAGIGLCGDLAGEC